MPERRRSLDRGGRRAHGGVAPPGLGRADRALSDRLAVAVVQHLAGTSVVVFTTVVGTSLFATLDEQQSTEIRIVIGSISVAAAILAGVQTFLNFAARATQHVLAADWYASIRRRIEQEMHPRGASGRPQEVHGRDPQGDEHRGFAVPRDRRGCGPRWPRSRSQV